MSDGDDVFRHRAGAIIDALVGGRGFDDAPDPGANRASSDYGHPLLLDNLPGAASDRGDDEERADIISDGDVGGISEESTPAARAGDVDDAPWVVVPPTADDGDASGAAPAGDARARDAETLSGGGDMSQSTDAIAAILRGDPSSDSDGGNVAVAESHPEQLDGEGSDGATTLAGGDGDPSAPRRRGLGEHSESAVSDDPAIPIGELPQAHDQQDNYRYDPHATSVGGDDDVERDGDTSAQFDVPASQVSLWDRLRQRGSADATSRRTLILLAAAVVVLLVVGAIVTMTLGSGDGGKPAAAITTNTPTVSPTPRPDGTPDDVDGDSQVPIADITSRCPAGSSNPKLAFDNQMSTAWICVRSYGLDGQVLRVRLEGAYVISSVAIVPGFNAATSDGKDQWSQHRTVTRVKYAFNDADRTVFNQTTNNVRNEVVTRVNPPVLASSVTITILQTAAPSSDTTDRPGNDLDDFAVSSITISGHRPS